MSEISPVDLSLVIINGGLFAKVGKTLLAVILGAVLLQLLQIVYNIWLHPLSKFPGPRLRSGIHLINYLDEIYGTQVANTKLLHDKYGPVVRISPDSLSFSTAQAWKDIYQVKPGEPEIQKDMNFFTQNTNKTPSILVSNTADHARIRKLVINGFSDSALRSQEPTMTHYIRILIDQLKRKVDGPEKGKVDIMSWYIFATFDTIGDLCFNETFQALETGTYHPWMKTVLAGIKNGRWIRLQHAYPFLTWMTRTYKFLTSGQSHLNIAREQHLKYTAQKTQKRLADTKPRDDIVTPIVKKNGPKGMSEAEIGQSLVLLTTAGSEPTAAGLSGATYHLLNNPDKLARLVREVRESFSDAEQINNAATQKLPYLHAVIEESLRLYPPVPSRFPRRTEIDGLVIDGHVVPKNTSVGVAQWATYQSTDNFANPTEFVPERWLDDAPEPYKDDVKASLQPFSMGPRNCIGKNFAYLQIRQILSRLLWHFDVELCAESENWAAQQAHLLWDMKPLYVKLSHRRA
ncbi:cytochrome P450 monooxygenase-like protein [Xylariaceae sp. FL0662B]|nr:cytochrome P450 monooxygenase-like protein [Xylariaceae sp. FL0662B]